MVHVDGNADREVTLAVVGAGMRGWAYGVPAAHHGARIVAVAEPDPVRRKLYGDRFEIPDDHRFADWSDLAARPRLADAALITTQDQLHADPAVALAGLGYHLLLEKPMATTQADCERIVDAVDRAGVLAAVCHVLRYTPYTRRLVSYLASGALGDIATVQHLEPIGYWHFGHSFVRGNWSREEQSAFTLLTKSCHDIDWLAHVIGRPVQRVASFGSLFHFRPEHKPAGASGRCLDCAVEPDCPYSAKRMYLTGPDRGRAAFARAFVEHLDPAVITEALRTGPYGRCVYDGQNDVVDQQVVILDYEGGATATFTMAAFTPFWGRQTRIMGTRGYLEGNGSTFTVHDFLTDRVHEIDPAAQPEEAAIVHSGHGGGDAGIARTFVKAVRQGNPSLLPTDVHTSLETHRIVFAAEHARRTGTVVDLLGGGAGGAPAGGRATRGAG